MIYSSYDLEGEINGVFNETTITGYLVAEMPDEYDPEKMAYVLKELLNDVYEQALKDAKRVALGEDLV